jgi:predicted amidohydrolase
MPKKRPIIAIAAIRYYDIKKTNNIEKILKYISLAKKKHADIICFPESCITKSRSIFINHKHIKSIQESCKKNTIWCIVTEDTEFKKKRYNSSILIDRKGKIKGSYQKINLYGDNVLPGKKIKVFQTDFARIGIAICWDLTFPGLFSAMRKKGAEIVFCPAQWNYDKPVHKSKHKYFEIQLLRSMTLARAHENLFYVALCNPLLKSKTQVSYSAIADPHRILKELIDKEGIITAEINLAEIRKVRKYYDKE